MAFGEVDMVKPEYIKFSHDYKKLQKDLFTTLRSINFARYFKAGNLYTVKIKNPEANHLEFKAKLLQKIKVRIGDLSTDFLCYDTDTSSREEALNHLFQLKGNRGVYQVEDNDNYILMLFQRRNNGRAKSRGKGVGKGGAEANHEGDDSE